LNLQGRSEEDASMPHRSSEHPAPRSLGYGSVRRKTVDVIVDYLRSEPPADPRPDAELLGRRQHLLRQPWRQPRRPGSESASTMELIRRFEARLKAH
jgi:hypothetical protein